MAIKTGVNCVNVFQLDGNPVMALGTYQLLDSGFVGGTVFRDALLSDIIMTRDNFTDLLKGAKTWIAGISHLQSTRITEVPDIPIDLNISITAPGIVYTIVMGDLEITATWDSSVEELTIGTFPAFSVSFQAYIYFINSLHDLAVSIDNL